MSSTPVRVICVVSSLDRDRCVDALRGARFVVPAVAADGREAMELALHYRPDLLLVDAMLDGLGALALVERARQRLPDMHVALVSAEPAPQMEMRAVLSGAHAFVVATWDEDMMRTLRTAARGDVATSPAVTGMLIQLLRTMPSAGAGIRPIRSPLTNREWEVLDRLSAGLPPVAVAREMHVSGETVHSHVKRICRKLGVRDYAEAVARADGLIVQAVA
jgi:two-component system nitrate/nitrite response regulator NarL